jgi:hypothetical protein
MGDRTVSFGLRAGHAVSCRTVRSGARTPAAESCTNTDIDETARMHAPMPAVSARSTNGTAAKLWGTDAAAIPLYIRRRGGFAFPTRGSERRELPGHVLY